jgi:hypothetical protein
MTTKKPREGSLLRIDLGDGTAVFVRVLANSQVAIYSYRHPDGERLMLPVVYGSPRLWTLTVMKSALTTGRWPVVDHRPLESDLTQPVEYFMRDRKSGEFSIYRSNDGHMRPSTYAECQGLEAAAVWEPEHVESRLRDHFAGRPNTWEEQLKASN